MTMENNEDVLEIIYEISSDIEYTVNDKSVVTILQKQDHKIQKFFRKLKFKIPQYKKTELDSYSSFVFLQINGENTIKKIGENLIDYFGEDINPLYERLLLFLNHIEINFKYINRVEK